MVVIRALLHTSLPSSIAIGQVINKLTVVYETRRSVALPRNPAFDPVFDYIGPSLTQEITKCRQVILVIVTADYKLVF
jgi:hypothetical protein